MRASRTAAVVAALLLGACNSGEDDPTVSAGGGTTAASATTTTAIAPPTTAALVAPPVTGPSPAGAQRAYLTDVRVAAADTGGSRVVFEFEPAVPAYSIDYVERPVTEDGSGAEVTVAGEAVLQVRLENASGARIDGEKVVLTYEGPKRVPTSGSGGVATEAVDTGDFEGVVTWAVGLRRKAPAISVSTLTSPARLVIDVPAPPP